MSVDQRSPVVLFHPCYQSVCVYVEGVLQPVNLDVAVIFEARFGSNSSCYDFNSIPDSYLLLGEVVKVRLESVRGLATHRVVCRYSKDIIRPRQKTEAPPQICDFLNQQFIKKNASCKWVAPHSRYIDSHAIRFIWY